MINVLWRVGKTTQLDIIENEKGRFNNSRWYSGKIPKEMYDKHIELVQELNSLEYEIQQHLAIPSQIKPLD